MTPRNPPKTAVSRHLVWVFLQGAVFLPMFAGQDFWETLTQHGALDVMSAALAAWVSFLLVRNLVRMWRAPASEARRNHCLPLFVVGAVFLLFASGPLLESERLSTKPDGVASLLIGVNLLVLGGRELLRLRTRRPEVPCVV